MIVIVIGGACSLIYIYQSAKEGRASRNVETPSPDLTFFFFCWPEGGKYCLTCFGREKREGCVPGRLRGNVDLGGDLRRDPAVGRGLGVVYMCTK